MKKNAPAANRPRSPPSGLIPSPPAFLPFFSSLHLPVIGQTLKKRTTKPYGRISLFAGLQQAFLRLNGSNLDKGTPMKIKPIIANLIQDDEGASMVEYAIMVGFIAAICIGVVTTLGRHVFSLFASVPDF